MIEPYFTVILDEDVQANQALEFVNPERKHVRLTDTHKPLNAPYGYALAMQNGKQGTEIMVVLISAQRLAEYP